MVDTAELQRRLGILKQKFDDGKIIIAEHLAEGFKESFGKVRYGSGGEVDLATVDGRVRSMAMMVAVMQDRDDTKAAASLAEIQDAYYQRITAMFQEAHRIMLDHGGNPQSVSWALSRDEDRVAQNYPLIEPFVSELLEFWEVMSEPVRYHLQDLDALKGVFGGDLFPSYERNIASSTGLYLDTIVLTDPFMNCRELFARWPKAEAVRMFLKHGLQLMNYRELVLAELNPSIVVILPFDSSHDGSYRDSLFSAAGVKALRHAEALFGRKFGELEELQEFLTSFEDPAAIVSALADSSRLLFDTEWGGDKLSQIDRAMEDFAPVMGNDFGALLFNQCFGRMSQATDISWKSQSLGGVPLVDAPTSWQYYNWSLEYGAAKDGKTNVPLHISRGMQRLADTDMQWLGNVPTDALIAIRKEGALEEIREMISKGVEDVVALNPENFFRSADTIYDNLEAAFSNYQSKVSDLKSKKWKFATSDIGSWVVTGSIEIAAAISGLPFVGVASVVASQLTDAPKLKDIPKKMGELRKEGAVLSKSAAGLLFRHRS